MKRDPIDQIAEALDRIAEAEADKVRDQAEQEGGHA